MASMFEVSNDSEFDELAHALMKRDRFGVNRWLAEKTHGRVMNLKDEVYEEWASLVQLWSFPNLKAEVTKLMRSLK